VQGYIGPSKTWDTVSASLGTVSTTVPNRERPLNAKRVGIWIRVSTEDQVRGESPETHERRARLYAEAKGWNVLEVYRLDAVSGKTVKDHPETKRMLQGIRDGHISGLIFSKLARLARNTRELLEFSELFREVDADLISLAESIDTSSPAGRLFYTMIAAMAQWEREEIAERVAASVPVRAKMGKPLGGAAPFGYQWHDGKLLSDPKEGPVRKLLYELFREYRRKKTVARLLNGKGYRTRNGSGFSDTTVARLIRDPTAKGVRRANYTQTTNNKKAWKQKPQCEWVLSTVEAIVSEDLWNECNAILDQRKGTGKRPTKQTVHLFAGLAFCACGGKMYVPSNSPKYICKACRNKIPIIDLDAVFHEQLKNFFFSPDELAAHLREADTVLQAKETLLAVLAKDRPRLSTEIDKLYELYQSGAIDKTGFGAKYHPLAERQRQLDDEIPMIQAEVDVMKIAHLSKDEIVSEARDLYSRWPTLPAEERRRIIEAITERITIGTDEVSIDLYYVPPAVARPSSSQTIHPSLRP
jgi:site-specific DNA recombinase